VPVADLVTDPTFGNVVDAMPFAAQGSANDNVISVADNTSTDICTPVELAR
jgi:hypothetical protein